MSSFFLALSLVFMTFEPANANDLTKEEKSQYQALLRDSLRFYDEYLRHPKTGMYFDAVSLKPDSKPETVTSVAATGMGLITLAISAATGVMPADEARSKAEQTLSFLEGKGTVDGNPFISRRSEKNGWFRHWFNANTGADEGDWTSGDGYSTIDTTILIAGAQLAANYFKSVDPEKAKSLSDAADRLLSTVKWESAIANANDGTLFMNFDIENEKPKAKPTSPFNEYVLVACLGKLAEEKAGKPGEMTKFWNRHFASPECFLKRKSYEGYELPTDHEDHHLSGFILQFATYLCSDVNQNESYLKELRQQRQADQHWFTKEARRPDVYGMAAGEVIYKDPSTGKVHTGYNADSQSNNPHFMVSPGGMAAYSIVHPAAISDLIKLKKPGVGVHTLPSKSKGDPIEVFWRHSVKPGWEKGLVPDRAQGVDFALLPLGLAAHPEGVGRQFFQDFAPGAKPRLEESQPGSKGAAAKKTPVNCTNQGSTSIGEPTRPKTSTR